MPWQGANVEKASEGAANAAANEEETRRSQETVEAALNRLSKAYSSAMNCVGAWYRAEKSQHVRQCNGDSAEEQASHLHSLGKVAQAARRTFEEAVLKDPLVAEKHAPLLFRTLCESQANGSEPPFQRRSAIELRSAGHQRQVKQLAYLTLVNYADLLLAGCGSTTDSVPRNSVTILDQGLVKPLASFSKSSCWVTPAPSAVAVGSSEDLEDGSSMQIDRSSDDGGESAVNETEIQEQELITVRFALTAYIDATEIDATDPTVWLKLACAARRLGRLVEFSKLPVPSRDTDRAMESPVFLLPYRRLERHALEHACRALPSNVAPNRTAVRALKEWWEEEEAYDTTEYTRGPISTQEPVQEKKLSIPRYSWSTVGRLILRACTDGAALASSADVIDKPWPPNVSLHISPLLVLPSNVLGKICQYLEPKHISRFEATCRALSASVVSARASLDHEAVRLEQKPSRELADDKKVVANVSIDQATEGEGAGSKDAADGESDKGGSEHAAAGESDKGGLQASRVSKRLRSQIITSGKRAERYGRRTSTEFCLLASTLGFSPDSSEYQKLVSTGIDWNSVIPTWNGWADLQRVVVKPSITGNSKKLSSNEENWSSVDGSLASFIEPWAGQSLPPMALLLNFVAHVSLNVGDVFLNDPGGLNVLSSTLLECFDLLYRRTGMSDEMISCFSSSSSRFLKCAPLGPVDLFAMDLLHAELRFRSCEGERELDTGFDGNSSFVARLAPHLAGIIPHIENDDSSKGLRNREWIKLKTRCYWLNAGFYLWKGRLSHNVTESREAETEGLLAINQAIQCLGLPEQHPIEKIQTPHLAAPSRRGQHWRELSILSLGTFSNEIQASSILLQTQEQFLDILSHFEEAESHEVLEQTQREALSAIGNTLYARYTSGSTSAKYSELVTDFLGEHGGYLLTKAYDESVLASDTDLVVWFSSVVPTSHVDGQYLLKLQRPCIMTILLCCLQVGPGREADILELMINICTAILELAEDIQCQLTTGERERSFEIDDADTDSDSDEDSLGGTIGLEGGKSEKDIQLKRLRQHSVLLRLLLRKMAMLYDDATPAGERGRFLGKGLVLLMHRILHFCSTSLGIVTSRKNTEGDLVEGCRLFQTLQGLAGIARKMFCTDESLTNSFARMYTTGLIGILRQQRAAMSALFQASGNRRGRSARKKIVQRRADIVAAVCCDLGMQLASQPFGVVDCEMVPSHLFVTFRETHLSAHVAVLCESLLWLWRALGRNDALDASKSETIFDRLCTERLRVPVGLAIVALCGSASSTRCLGARRQSPSNEETMGLGDFYDSDNSALEWLADEGDDEGASKREHLLCVVGQAAHCISQVLNSIDETELMDFRHVQTYHSASGPSLPLVAARVLNQLADILLLNFSDKPEKKSLWGDYPFGTRSTGRLLDSILCKAYKCLHGFTLVNSSDGNSSLVSAQKNKPESATAAVHLYRCIMRAYSQGRKSPPKLAFDTVLSALPPLESTTKSKTIHEYLFATDDKYSTLKSLSNFVSRGAKWESCLLDVQDWFHILDEDDTLESEDGALTVRRGMSRLVAQGPLPQYVEAGGDDEQRSSTSNFESELCRKFFAILDSLGHGNIDDYEAWYKAAQCLAIKADLVADRLGLSQGFSRSPSFVASRQASSPETSLGIDELLENQFRETHLNEEGWTQCLGVDLSVFVTFCWSSFESLQSCSKAVGRGYQSQSDSGLSEDERVEYEVWQGIERLREKGDFVAWQQAWGGLFVSALRKISLRCIRLALYILYKRESPEDDQILISEVAESLGVNLYTELVGSQMYGYPMHAMTHSRKRELAQAALSCFEQAINVVQTSESPLRPTWDLKLMVGKCHEKVAKTFWRESFQRNQMDSETLRRRKYEHHMSKALSYYHSSLTEAKELESSNELVVDKNGGSSHGAYEVVYRLHASRLKCLIAAVSRTEEERELAEMEALRLTEQHAYAGADAPFDKTCPIRDRVWNVLADIVTALAHCRLNVPFFHRSVYRHAQALMWAPVLCDPKSVGSLDTVPATRAVKLRGLNYSTNAAGSAAVVMGSLFEKKRAQLCAVWMTSDSSESAFQTLNDSVRKYDSLRGKYIAAYVETLRLCNRRNELEVFLKWVYSARRDLPSYFAASAAAQGGKPNQSPSDDSLLVRTRLLSSHHFLTTVKRQTNSALSSVILHDVQESGSKDQKSMENILKLAYACYLRLNCDARDLVKGREWKSYRSTGNKVVVKAMTTAYLAVAKEDPLQGRPVEWSGESQLATLLEVALKKCHELFPTLSGSFFSKRGQGRGKKRKVQENEVSERAFEVPIPPGLSAGDKFVTSIKMGDKIKKVRLTVPPGASEALRFTLQDTSPEKGDKSPE